MRADVIAIVGPPDGTPGWHRRYRDADREWAHSVQRAAFRVECQQLAYEAAQDELALAGEVEPF